MIKFVVFLSLYAAVGIGSWSAYTYMTNQDTSIDSLKQFVTKIQPLIETNSEKNNSVYRWKDYQGNWNYENTPFTELKFDSYEEELKFLKHLHKSQNKFIAKESTNPETLSLSTVGQVEKLLKDAKNIEKLLAERQKAMDRIVNNSK